MRRSPFIVTVLFLLLSVGCTKTDVKDIKSCSPLSFAMVSRPQTKGYITGSTFRDTHADSLHVTSSANWRTLVLSGYISSVENNGNYFIGETFVHDNDRWVHNPELYWPIASTMNFLGYSCTIPFEDSACKWGNSDCSDYVSLTVSKDYTQDDIVFGSAYGCKSTDGASPVSMVMKHSQAWIQFRLHVADTAIDSVITITNIVLSDVYTTGQLDIENNHGSATASWDYRFDTRKDTDVDDNMGVYGTPLTTAVSYLDMLLPEQDKKTIVIYYTLPGSSIVFRHSIELSLSTWLMGKKYIYDISISLNKITVSPSVEEWTVENEPIEL